MLDPVYSAEAMLCAALLEAPQMYEEVRWLDKDKFWNGDNRTVYVAITWVLEHHPDVDVNEVPGRVRQLLTEYKQMSALARLIDISGAYPGVPSLAVTYAHSIHEAHQHEVIKNACISMSQIAGSENSIEWKTAQIDTMWTKILTEATARAGWQPIDGLHTVNEFMDLSDQSYDWVIPGMLERQERFMLIAPEKAGKTVLTRQVALTLASGRHPFNIATEVPVMRTLLVDLENPAGAARRDFRRQVVAMEDVWSTDNQNAYMLHRPAGIHLGDPQDRAMLRQVVDRLDIDLLCISPIYKAYDGLDQSWEEQAFGVQKPLDRLRQDFNLAIWMEHHAPWGERGQRVIRPIGSTRWGRWLDYQCALVPEQDNPPFPSMEWRAIRRDERKMAPRRLVRSSVGASWIPEWSDEGGFGMAMDQAIH